MGKEEIEVEYRRLHSNGTIPWTDNDLTFPLLLHAIKERHDHMSDQELSILHMYFEMRKTIGFIEFKSIYPILKNGMSMVCIHSKRDIVTRINNMLNLGIKLAPNEYELQHSMSPACKSHYSRCYSPSPCTTDSTDSTDSFGDECFFPYDDDSVVNYDLVSGGYWN